MSIADPPPPKKTIKQDLQDSVIKCVRFAPSSSPSPHRLALAGDDRDVRIVDLRTGAKGNDGLAVPQAHARTVHTLRWHPTEVR